ncbi:MAG: TAXI family TRAP transporter solute-binding subunit [Smithellaceae bacterium]|nr:TAXI family TRAP transporter solute-binding subunit [Smithellaceae bacterium]
MKRMIGTMALVVFALLSGFAAAQEKINISIGTGGTGGVYYPMGGGLANILTKYVPGMQATAEVTGGSVANLQLLGTGKSEVGFSMVDAALDALQGQEKFTTGKIPVRALMVLYPNRMHVVSVETTGIKKMSDLKGKRVSTGSAGSATEVMAFRVIEAVGLDRDKDMKRERLGVAESVNAIKDGKIDAFFWVGGIPTAAVTDLGATPGTKIQMVDHAEATEGMNKKYGPLYVRDVIPAKSYPGQETPNQVVTVWNILVAHEKMSDQVAYNIVKTIFDKKPEMVAVHKEALNFDLRYQTNDHSPIPYHPGAIKYFAEKGIKVR